MMAKERTEHVITDFDVKVSRPPARPMWQHPGAIAVGAVALALLSGIGTTWLIKGLRPASNGKVVQKSLTQSQTNDRGLNSDRRRTSESAHSSDNKTRSAENASEKNGAPAAKSARRIPLPDEQLVPLATGDKPNWPTLQDPGEQNAEAGKVAAPAIETAPGAKTPASNESQTKAALVANSGPRAPVLTLFDSVDEVLGAEKKPVPGQAAIGAAKRALRVTYKNDYAQIKKQDIKIAFAKTLLTRGKELVGDPAEGYVMLSEAADLAAEAGQLGLSWDATVAVATHFDVSALPQLERAARTALPFVKTFDEMRVLLTMYTTLFDEAIRVNDFDTAMKATQAATVAVRKPAFSLFREQVAAANRRVAALKSAFEAVKPARIILQTQPTDPTASLAWGRFVCFHKNNWDDGLQFLARSVDPVWGQLALRETGLNEMSPPPEPQEFEKLGDAWWEAAEKEPEPQRSLIREHAAESYLLAADRVPVEQKSALLQKIVRVFGSTRLVESSGDQSGAVIAPVDLNPGELFTIEFWVSTQATSGALVSKRHQEAGESTIRLQLDNGLVAVVSDSDSQAEMATGKAKINDGEWHHIAAVKLAKALILFVDGKIDAELAGSEKYASKSPWKVGASAHDKPIAARFAQLRFSNTPRYLVPFAPEKQYGKDAATSFMAN